MSIPLISVIVPVFRVEEYLHRCVDSILSQSYSNIEVILVDDGSPDSCPSICDEYAEQNTRVRVIHKTNGGLSSARNAGLDYDLKGDYVVFLDSDDWIEQDAFEYGLNLITKYNAEAVQYRMRLIDTVDRPIKQPKEKVSVIRGKEVVQYYMRHSTVDSGEYSVCIGIYLRQLFDGLRFREGKVNEDIDFKYRLMNRCNTLVVTNQIKYNYYQTGDTISSGGLKKRDFQLREAGDLLASLTADEKYGSIAFLGKVKQARTAFSLLCKIAYFGVADPAINKGETIIALTAEHRENLSVLLRSPMSMSRKILAILFAVNYQMTEMIIRLMKKK